MREEVPPTVSTETRAGEREELLDHPAFGQISVSRITGSRALYGSDFMHHSWVQFRIGSSQLRRGLSRDWYYKRRDIIEIDMSEAQWATFVSSFNVGEGVPCTFSVRDGKPVPEFPLRDSTEKYKAEADKKLASSIAAIDDTLAEIEALNIPKIRKQALGAKLRKAHQELRCNLPFVAESFAAHMEDRVEKAKVEVEGYINGRIRDAGLQAIAGEVTAPQCIEVASPPKKIAHED